MKIKKAFIILIFLIGFIVFSYPVINKEVSQYKIEKTIKTFNDFKEEFLLESGDANLNLDEEVDSDDIGSNKESDRLYRVMNDYNSRIYKDKQVNLVDPFSYERNSFDLTEFGFENNIIGYITIPKINIEIPIYLGATQENMKKGAAHLSETSIPIGGVSTNSVISAHRGMKSHPMFRDIEMLEIGDEIKVSNIWDELIYKVVELKVITPDEISEVLIQEGRDLITLITCHPYTKNYQRYVVYCERQEELDYKESIQDDETVDVLKKEDIKSEQTYNIVKIEKNIRYIGLILIIVFVGYISYKIIRSKSS